MERFPTSSKSPPSPISTSCPHPYHSLCKNPENEIQNIYKFLGVRQYKHYFKNVDQFEVNGIKYHDEINDSYKNLHDVRATIKQQEINVDQLIPSSIIKKYEHLNFEYLTPI